MAHALNRSDASEHRMNMAALQRVDPFIGGIVTSAKQVALYRYVSEDWTKTEIEGTLFVYERQADPQYGFIILNRLSSKNLVEPVTKELNFQLQTPFLLYKTKEDDIFGVWFYDKKECEQVSKTVQGLVEKTEAKMQQKRDQSAASAASSDLGALLMKASGGGGGGGGQPQQQQQQQGKKGNKKAQQQVQQVQQAPAATSSTEAPAAPGGGGDKLMRLLSSASIQAQAGSSADLEALAGSPPSPQAPAQQQPQQQQGGGNRHPSPPIIFNGNKKQQQENGGGGAAGGGDKIASFLQQLSMTSQPQQQQQQPPQSAFTAPGPGGQQQQQQQPGGLPGSIPVHPIPLMGPHPPPGAPGGPPGGAGPPPPGHLVPIPMLQHQIMALNAMAAQQHQAQAAAAAAAQITVAMQQQQAAAAAAAQQQQQQHRKDASPHAKDQPENPMARLLADPNALSVENLERRQRLESQSPATQQQQGPAASASPAMPPMPTAGIMSADELESDLKAGDKKKAAAVREEPTTLLSPMAFAARNTSADNLTPAATFASVAGKKTGARVNGVAAAATGGGGQTEIAPLTKAQLQQAFEHLLRTDRDFVGRLHRAYVDSLANKLN